MHRVENVVIGDFRFTRFSVKMVRSHCHHCYLICLVCNTGLTDEPHLCYRPDISKISHFIEFEYFIWSLENLSWSDHLKRYLMQSVDARNVCVLVCVSQSSRGAVDCGVASGAIYREDGIAVCISYVCVH